MKTEDKPEQLIEAYIKGLEAGSRGNMILISSRKVIRWFKVESPHLKAQISRLLPRIAERYGYVATRIGRRRVYVKTLKAPSTIDRKRGSRRLRLTLHQPEEGHIHPPRLFKEGAKHTLEEYAQITSPYSFNAPPFRSFLRGRVEEEE